MSLPGGRPFPSVNPEEWNIFLRVDEEWNVYATSLRTGKERPLPWHTPANVQRCVKSGEVWQTMTFPRFFIRDDGLFQDDTHGPYYIRYDTPFSGAFVHLDGTEFPNTFDGEDSVGCIIFAENAKREGSWIEWVFSERGVEYAAGK